MSKGQYGVWIKERPSFRVAESIEHIFPFVADVIIYDSFCLEKALLPEMLIHDVERR